MGTDAWSRKNSVKGAVDTTRSGGRRERCLGRKKRKQLKSQAVRPPQESLNDLGVVASVTCTLLPVSPRPA